MDVIKLEKWSNDEICSLIQSAKKVLDDRGAMIEKCHICGAINHYISAKYECSNRIRGVK